MSAPPYDTRSPGHGVAAGGAEDPSPPAAAERRVRNRRHVLLSLVLAAVLVAVGGLAASTRIKSPAELAAETRPPVPTLLTATVVREVLSSTVVVRGTVTAERRLEITPAAAVGAEALVVTRVRKPAGATVAAGDVVVDVSGRPLYALLGQFPAYRDIKPGDRGDDVRQLQAALAALRYSTPLDGVFANATRRAVTAFYRDRGYEPPVAGDAAALAAAEQAVTEATRQLREARRSDDSAAASAAASELAAARRQHAALLAVSGSYVPRGEVAFLPSFPAYVAGLSARVGEAVKAPLLTLTAGLLVVRGEVGTDQAGLVRQGMRVEIADEVSGVTVPGKVTHIGGAVERSSSGDGSGDPTAPPAPAAGVGLLVTPAKPLSTESLGHEVRLTVVAARSAGPVLAVPVAAITSGANGDTYVTVVGRGGAQRRVPVRAGMSGSGLVEITPLTDDAVAPGDAVVTGV
ncbi:MAG TPA: peptidoglycan-binding domain-containing protein [Mycobacteriales bacterium]|jgi:peptidoglycan hydrolase-like protein with peptidoglycan-binding domain|nr:peptidoglycan-binding domain-containing protein [Mycobacteriales bacterium]